MTASVLAMSPPVTAALISGGAALAVALLGIAGAIVAQISATRRAFGNSLALLERQRADQERQQQEQARREDSYRFAEQRRSTYGRFANLAREFADAVDSERTSAKNLERADRQRDGIGSSSPGTERRTEEAEHALSEARELKQRLDHELGAAYEEIYLLGSPEVRQAADQLWRAAHEATYSADRDYLATRAGFLDAVRRELGIATDSPS